jgi:hypothetical protein
MPLNKMGGGDAAPDPTAHVGEERGGISAGDCRLLVALRPIASRPVVDPLIEVYERVTALPVRRRRRYSAVNVEDLTTVELRSRELAVGHLKVYRAAAPGFSAAFLMLGAPQIGVRHSRRLAGLRKVTRQQWDTGQVWDDEIGVSPSLAPKFPNISVPYGSLLPESLDNILGAGRHVACDASSHTFLRDPTVLAHRAGSRRRRRARRQYWHPAP